MTKAPDKRKVNATSAEVGEAEGSARSHGLEADLAQAGQQLAATGGGPSRVAADAGAGQRHARQNRPKRPEALARRRGSRAAGRQVRGPKRLAAASACLRAADFWPRAFAALALTNR